MAGSWTEASRRLVAELADGGGVEQLWAMLYAAQTAALRLALLPGLNDDLTFTDAALKLRDAREELERVHPQLPAVAPAVDLGDPPLDQVAACRAALVALLGAILDTVDRRLAEHRAGLPTAEVLALARVASLARPRTGT